jgi:hypothetical protein
LDVCVPPHWPGGNSARFRKNSGGPAHRLDTLPQLRSSSVRPCGHSHSERSLPFRPLPPRRHLRSYARVPRNSDDRYQSRKHESHSNPIDRVVSRNVDWYASELQCCSFVTMNRSLRPTVDCSHERCCVYMYRFRAHFFPPYRAAVRARRGLPSENSRCVIRWRMTIRTRNAENGFNSELSQLNNTCGSFRPSCSTTPYSTSYATRLPFHLSLRGYPL